MEMIKNISYQDNKPKSEKNAINTKCLLNSASDIARYHTPAVIIFLIVSYWPFLMTILYIVILYRIYKMPQIVLTGESVNRT